MKILIVTRDKIQEIPEFLKKIKERKIVWKNELSKKNLKDIELVIAIGGDGTFLSASHFIDNQIILGVNNNPLKSEGHLVTTDLTNLEKKLGQILNNNFRIKEYTRENTKIFKKNCCLIAKNALNENYFGNRNPHHPSDYEIEYKDRRESQRSSGVLISTGTGSTAWYKSMHGRRYSQTKQQLRFRIRELFTGRLFKARIRKGKINSGQKLTIISKINHGILAIDSIRVYRIEKGDRIEISLGRPLRVIQ